MRLFSCCRRPAPPIDTTPDEARTGRRGSIHVLSDDAIPREEHERRLQQQSSRHCKVVVAFVFLAVIVHRLTKGDAPVQAAVRPSDDLERCWQRNLHLLADCEIESRISCEMAQPNSFLKETAFKCKSALKKCLQAAQNTLAELQKAYLQGYQDRHDRKPRTNYNPKSVSQ